MKKPAMLNIPNTISVVRILLIPVFVVLYLRADSPAMHLTAAAILLVSGLTDMLDGYIARKYDMVTALGRILDPLADKLTQASVCICLAIRYPALLFIPIALIAKEVIMLLAGLGILKRSETPDIPGAKWFGKLYTLLFYTGTLVIVGFPQIGQAAILAILILLVALMLFTLIMYIPVFFKTMRSIRKDTADKR